MIPGGRLSTTSVPADYFTPDDRDPPDFLTDYELGGIALSDPSEGLQVLEWTVRYDGVTGNVMLSAPSVAETVIFTEPAITEISLAFDQNMRPFFAYVQAGRAKFRWYDTDAGRNVVTELSAGDRNPRCCMDDKRDMQVSQGANDIILAYVRADKLYYRQQRDRYETEYLLAEEIPAPILLRVGMAKNYRLQFMFV